jgi:hypothetical protein
MAAFTVRVGRRAVRVQATTSDAAVLAALGPEGSVAPGFRGVTIDDVAPKADGRFGAPMGRASDRLDAEGFPSARQVRIDSQGYDKGGAYWGLRPRGQRLYAVQDGMGNVAFVDAASHNAAIETAFAA